MPKQPIAVELEAINREGETQVVRDSGLTVHGYSVYLRAMEASGLGLATWVADYDTIDQAYELAERWFWQGNDYALIAAEIVARDLCVRDDED